MRIRDLYDRPVPTISFEFFPPKNDAAEAALFADTVPGLKALNPAFISVTYGAGGSTRDTTTRIVQRIREQHGIESMPHLTCVGSTQAMLGNFLDDILKLGFPPSAAFNKRKAEAQDARDRFAEAVRTIVGERLRPVYVLLDREPDPTAVLSDEELIDRLKAEFDAEELGVEGGA